MAGAAGAGAAEGLSVGVSLMANKLVNFRVKPDLHDALEAEASRLGVDKSVVLREALEARLTSGVPLLGSTAPSSNDSADMAAEQETLRRQGRSVDLVVWLSGRSGFPKALVRQRIKAGRVLVNGVVATERGAASVPASLVAMGVELDGEVY